MKKSFFAVLVFVFGCAHAPRTGGPETRPMPPAPKVAAETVPVPESVPADDPLSEKSEFADALARMVEDLATEVRAALPRKGSGYRSICGTPEFDAFGETLSTNWEQMKMAVMALHTMLEATGKEIPDADIKAVNSAIRAAVSTCSGVGAICASEASEFACYDAVAAHMDAIRVYTDILAKLLR